jgi:hypothetical protein
MIDIAVEASYTNPYNVPQLRADQQAVEYCSWTRHPLNQCRISQELQAIRMPQQKEQQDVTPGLRLAQ